MLFYMNDSWVDSLPISEELKEVARSLMVLERQSGMVVTMDVSLDDSGDIVTFVIDICNREITVQYAGEKYYVSLNIVGKKPFSEDGWSTQGDPVMLVTSDPERVVGAVKFAARQLLDREIERLERVREKI